MSLFPARQDGALLSSRLTVPSRGFSLPNPGSGDPWVPPRTQCPFLCPFLAGQCELCVWELTACLAGTGISQEVQMCPQGCGMDDDESQGADWVGLAHGTLGKKLGQNRAAGIMARSHHDAVPQKHGSLRCKGNKLEAVSNFPEAHQHVLPPLRVIRFQAEKSWVSIPAWEAFCISQIFPLPLAFLSLKVYISTAKCPPLNLRAGHSRGTCGIITMYC